MHDLIVLLALTLSAGAPDPITVLVAPRGDPFVAAAPGPGGSLIVTRSSGELIVLDDSGIVRDVSCANRCRLRLGRHGDRRRPPALRVDEALRLARKVGGFTDQNAWDLFVFPYGTTGEPYLELAPDSPAFWGVVQGARNTTWTLVDGPVRPAADVGRRSEQVAEVTSSPEEVDGWEVSPGRIALRRADPAIAGGAWCAPRPTFDQTLRDVANGDAAWRRVQEAAAPPWWSRVLPVLDIGGGVTRVEGGAQLLAVFLSGVERSEPARFVRRTFQGHVQNDEAATLDRARLTAVPYLAASLRFDLDRLVVGASVSVNDRRLVAAAMERRMARAGALLDEEARLCARSGGLRERLRHADIVEELAILAPSWRALSPGRL